VVISTRPAYSFLPISSSFFLRCVPVFLVKGARPEHAAPAFGQVAVVNGLDLPEMALDQDSTSTFEAIVHLNSFPASLTLRDLLWRLLQLGDIAAVASGIRAPGCVSWWKILGHKRP
jgi:hypothetical protein